VEIPPHSGILGDGVELSEGGGDGFGVGVGEGVGGGGGLI